MQRWFWLAVLVPWLVACGAGPGTAPPTVAPSPTVAGRAVAPAAVSSPATSPPGAGPAGSPAPAVAATAPAVAASPAAAPAGSAAPTLSAVAPTTPAESPTPTPTTIRASIEITVLPTLTPAPTPAASALTDYTAARATLQARTGITLTSISDAIRLSAREPNRADAVGELERARAAFERALGAIQGLSVPAEAQASQQTLVDAYTRYVEASVAALAAVRESNETERLNRINSAGTLFQEAFALEQRSNAQLGELQAR